MIEIVHKVTTQVQRLVSRYLISSQVTRQVTRFQWSSFFDKGAAVERGELAIFLTCPYDLGRVPPGVSLPGRAPDKEPPYVHIIDEIIGLIDFVNVWKVCKL